MYLVKITSYWKVCVVHIRYVTYAVGLGHGHFAVKYRAGPWYGGGEDNSQQLTQFFMITFVTN